MRKEAALAFWNRYLRLVNRGSAKTPEKNPATLFTRDAKSGKYDQLSDEEYDQRLHDCEQLASLWQDLPARAAGELLLTALNRTDIDDGRLEQLAGLLAECSAGTDYLFPLEREPAALPDFTPRAVYSRLCRHVLGQDAAKKAAAMVIFNHLNGRRSNTLFCGPSGCGKIRDLALPGPGVPRSGPHL